MARKIWTKEDMDYLRDNYYKMTKANLALQLGVSMGALYTEATVLGVANKSHSEPALYKTYLTVAEASEMVNQDVTEWKRYGLKLEEKRKGLVVDLDNLVKVMKKHPYIYDATECDYMVFEYYPFFHEKRLEDRKKKIDERWKIAL